MNRGNESRFRPPRAWPGLAALLFLLSACAHAPGGPQPWAQRAVATPRPATATGFEEERIADPIEPWNRTMFRFNDTLYMRVIKPATKAYDAVMPEGVRVSVRNFFINLDTPVRAANAVLQGNVPALGVEVARFTLNSTLGLAGFMDVARDRFNIQPQEKDLGLTLGKWGFGEGFYIVWPALGPSTLRDSIGMAGDDFFLTPISYVSPTVDAFGISAYDYFNRASLELGQYEEMKASSLEPYTAFKNAYFQYRRHLLRKDP